MTDHFFRLFCWLTDQGWCFTPSRNTECITRTKGTTRRLTIHVGDHIDIAEFGQVRRVTIMGLTSRLLYYSWYGSTPEYVMPLDEFRRRLVDAKDVVESVTLTL